MDDTLIKHTVGRVTLTVERKPDYDPDLSWMGEYSNTPGPYAIDTGKGSRYLQYFNPPWENYKGEPEEEIKKYCRQDFERMEAYNRGDWWMLGICATVTVSHDSWAAGKEIGRSSVWGVESDGGDWINKTAQEQGRAALRDARSFLRSLEPRERVAA